MPGSLTSVFQLKELYSNDFATTDHQFTASERIKKSLLEQIVDWISHA